MCVCVCVKGRAEGGTSQTCYIAQAALSLNEEVVGLLLAFWALFAVAKEWGVCVRMRERGTWARLCACARAHTDPEMDSVVSCGCFSMSA